MANQNRLPMESPLIEEELDDTHLTKSLNRLETFLRVLGFCQYSVFSFCVSWLLFLVLGVGLPLYVIQFSYCTNCEKEKKKFELEVLASQSIVAAISLLCISHNLRKYGVRKFLFVDRSHGHLTQFLQEYILKINVSLFFFFVLYCLVGVQLKICSLKYLFYWAILISG